VRAKNRIGRKLGGTENIFDMIKNEIQERLLQMNNESNPNQAWNALRATLQNMFSFHDIKEIVGLAGFDLVSISRLDQAGFGSSKGQLMTGIDCGLNAFDEELKIRFIAIVAEEILRRRPDLRQSLDENLSRLGWSLCGNAVIPIEIFDASTLGELPSVSHADLTKAAQRLRNGDLSGSISSVCGALDVMTVGIYASAGLGDPTDASFQERCKRSLVAKGVLPKLDQQLRELGWKDNDIGMFKKNFEGAINQGAYVMQTLRSKMGDVHGTKPILKPLVFDCLKWAELILRALMED
jgi:hypothetical protein